MVFRCQARAQGLGLLPLCWNLSLSVQLRDGDSEI